MKDTEMKDKSFFDLLKEFVTGKTINVYHVHVLKNGRALHEGFVGSLSPQQVDFYKINGVVEVLPRKIVDVKLEEGGWDEEPDTYTLVLDSPVFDLNGTGRETIKVDVRDPIDFV